MIEIAKAAIALLALTSCSKGWQPASHQGEPATCQRFRLQFAPAPGSSFEHSGSFSKRTSAGSLEQGSFEERIVLRAEGDSYVATVTPARGDQVTYQLDAHGHASHTGTGSLDAQREAAWNGLVEELNGLEGCVGDAHVKQADMKLTNGSVHYWSALRVSGFVDCQLGRCLRLERRENSDPYVLKGWLEDFAVKPVMHRGESRLRGQMTVVVDPSTLRLVSVDADREIAVVPSDGNEITTREDERHSFRY